MNYYYFYYPTRTPYHPPVRYLPYVHRNPLPFTGPHRQFPTVDPGMFMNSAKELEVMMQSASVLLSKMAQSRSFSFELMSAAQESKMEKVQSLIKTTGITLLPKVEYTPSGLRLTFESSADSNAAANCCQLALKLRWS
ncbi:hypothetical protein [Cytobacillus gottheilii]|uniref:hypothetical protein n=1 Tax=Cytobacillus gottheilii TaxID=859144 RepID=UPI0024943A7D|nr:hypothetical protein [Cytobacillus gottheilii]